MNVSLLIEAIVHKIFAFILYILISRLISHDKTGYNRNYNTIMRNLINQCDFPVGIWCQNDVASTSMRRHHIAPTLIRRYFTSCFCWVSKISKITECRSTLIIRHLLPVLFLITNHAQFSRNDIYLKLQ